ncbi:MAG: dihydroorotase [Proteobacteria bacterium]|nr:dihydroorotase [Pseudomonadota bacterium]
MRVLTGATVIDPSQNIEEELDVLIDDGRVRDLGRPGSFSHATVLETINLPGRWITPGFIDLHVHLREPGFEWKETIKSGADAAALGGYTSICCMPNTRPVNDCAEITRFILEKARETRARVLPIGSVTRGLKGEEMSPLSELRKAGCVAFSDDGEPVWSAGMMRRALEWALMLDVPISCHEEDKSLSDGGCMNESALSLKLGLKGMHKVAEDVMVARDIELGRVTGGKVHICHVSSARSVELIRRSKHDGIRITAEVTPHHITLTEDAVGDYDTYAKMSPPLREDEDIQALLAGLKDGTIDAIASDHAPHEEDSKRMEFSKATFGIIGLQTALPLLLERVSDGVLSRRRAIETMSTGPARSFGIDGGTLRKGSAADLVVIDPSQEWTLSRDTIVSLSKNSPFYGRTTRGRAELVMVGGRFVVRNGELV